MSEQVEAEARQMGWKPQEEFKGDPDKWIDAETFVERGKTVLPILRKDNEKLHGHIGQLTEQVSHLQGLLTESQESIKALMEFHDQDAKRRVDAAIRKVKSELTSAQAAGDHEAVAELTDQLVDLKAAAKEEKPASKKPDGEDHGGVAPKKDFSKEPWFVQWRSENSWYGNDQVKTAVANSIAMRLRAEGDTSMNEAFLNKVAEQTERELAQYGGGGRAAQRVEAGAGRGNGGGGGSKTYADLPADAKAACDKQGQRLVGEGRAFKTQQDWRKYYVDLYYKE